MPFVIRPSNANLTMLIIQCKFNSMLKLFPDHNGDNLQNIFQEMSSMQKLTHPNVVPYYGLSMEHQTSVTTVRIFEEFVHGSNFSHFLFENLPVDLSALRFYVTSLLEALAFMHQVRQRKQF